MKQRKFYLQMSPQIGPFYWVGEQKGIPSLLSNNLLVEREKDTSFVNIFLIWKNTSSNMVSFIIRSVLPLEWHSMTLIENPSFPPLPILKFSFLGCWFLQTRTDPITSASQWVNISYISWKRKYPCQFLSQQKNGCFWMGRKEDICLNILFVPSLKCINILI